jgi:hypothetical protein
VISYDGFAAMVAYDGFCPVISYDDRHPMIAHDWLAAMVADDGLLPVISDETTFFCPKQFRRERLLAGVRSCLGGTPSPAFTLTVCRRVRRPSVCTEG